MKLALNVLDPHTFLSFFFLSFFLAPGTSSRQNWRLDKIGNSGVKQVKKRREEMLFIGIQVEDQV